MENRDSFLYAFRVSLVESCNKNNGFTIIFECWAEDFEHSSEQAEDAYPNCMIREIENTLEKMNENIQ